MNLGLFSLRLVINSDYPQAAEVFKKAVSKTSAVTTDAKLQYDGGDGAFGHLSSLQVPFRFHELLT